MINTQLLSAVLLGAALLASPLAPVPAASAADENFAAYIGDEPTPFDTPEAGVQAFKDAMAAAAFKALQADLEHTEAVPAQTVRLPVNLVVRGSTGPAKR